MPGRSMNSCRACSGPVSRAFETRVLGRYNVTFWRCQSCDSLQSDPPYWLAEAYQAAIAATDTGAAQRNLACHSAIVAVARTLKATGRFLDYGGGAGMVCRLLRDSGFDAYLSDRYADPVYARGFTLDLDSVAPGELGVLSAIEVLEHFANPAEDLGRLFGLRPRVLFATTIPYRGEGESWWYLTKHTGQHVFFYSLACLRHFARTYGYDYLGVGSFHVFSAVPLTRWQKAVLRALLSGLGLRVVRTWIAATLGGRYCEADSVALTREVTSGDALSTQSKSASKSSTANEQPRRITSPTDARADL